MEQQKDELKNNYMIIKDLSSKINKLENQDKMYQISIEEYKNKLVSIENSYIDLEKQSYEYKEQLSKIHEMIAKKYCPPDPSVDIFSVLQSQAVDRIHEINSFTLLIKFIEYNESK